MDISAKFIAAISATSMSVAAILCGVALLHLVMVKLIKHRERKLMLSRPKSVHKNHPSAYARPQELCEECLVFREQPLLKMHPRSAII